MTDDDADMTVFVCACLIAALICFGFAFGVLS